MKPWILVTPSSRGIGLALTHHLLRTTNAPILATVRTHDLHAAKSSILEHPSLLSASNPPNAPLSSSSNSSKSSLLTSYASRLHLTHLNVLDEPSIAAAASFAGRTFGPRAHLHLAFVVPGILVPEKAAAQIDAEAALLTLRTNALGPLLVAKHFAPFLPARAAAGWEAAAAADTGAGNGAGSGEGDGARMRKDIDTDTDTNATSDSLQGLPRSRSVLALMSARVGSISDNRAGGWFSYRASKAAVNQLVKTLDVQVRSRSGARACVLGLHPGTTRTELSRAFWDRVPAESLFEPDRVAEMLCDVVRSDVGRGRIWDYKGDEILP